MKKFEWEMIFKSDWAKTKRLKVPGGWIILHEAWDSNCQSESMVFVPEPEHRWQVEKVE